ncbi:MAG: hypothetical protein AAGK97_05070, partial [Bacteroidota bacterium]
MSPDGIPGCGGVLNNESWFSFVASEGDISLMITPFNCIDVANGPNVPNLDIQAALYEVSGSGCPNPSYDPPSDNNVLFCKDDCAIAPQVINWNFTSTRGQQYLIVLDGCSGDICDILIEFTGQGTAPIDLTEIADINGIGEGGILNVCSNVDVSLTVNGDSAYQSYSWTTDNGDFIANEATIIQNFTEEGNYSYCVQGVTGCGSSEVFCITVQVEDNITPIFDPIGPFCESDSLQFLPSTSSNGITGVWNGQGVSQGNIFDPSVGTQEITFTPNLGQCGVEVDLTIEVNQLITPTFNSIGTLCSDDGAVGLPTTSNNGISGSWIGDGVLGGNAIVPIQGFDFLNITFIPANDQCAINVDFQIPIVDINVQISAVNCNDAGTPQDPSDDLFVFDILVDGNSNASPTGWISDDIVIAQGQYGVAQTLGPFPISNGIVVFDVLDNQEPFCTELVIVNPPPTCSNNSGSCSINPLSIQNILCNDQNTPSDPSDDTYTFAITVTGSMTSDSGWVSNSPSNDAGAYNQSYVFGPFLISNGSFILTISDANDASCQQSIEVVPPSACSGTCNIFGSTFNLICDDNNTASDPTDDTYFFDLIMEGQNMSNTWIANDDTMTTGIYVEAVNFGPFLISNGPVNFTINDNIDTTCTYMFNVNPPETCSNTCLISGSISNIICDDNQTDDPSDDTYTFELLMMGSNESQTGWTANNQNSGMYGVSANFGPYLITDGPISFEVMDNDDPSCSEVFQVTPPASCSMQDTSCQILDIVILDTICNNGSTPGDPSDDTYMFDILVNGSNVSDGWSANDPLNSQGMYNTN